MNLLIDSISSPASLVLFSDNREVKSHKEIEIALNESSKLPEEIFSFLSENQCSHKKLKNCVVVHGPGSFTGVRATVLIANSLAFKTDTKLTPINYFELYGDYPIAKTSSKRDVFVKMSSNSEIEILTNSHFLDQLRDQNVKNIHGDFEKIEDLSIILHNKPNYTEIIKNLILEDHRMIEALYIKKPNIS